MSTYLQGVTDYIPEIQQYQPNFDLISSTLKYRQSLYDEAREKIADVYNTVLNSPMLRDVDNAKREDFFKQIDNDIKKISRMDLSLKQNQNMANHIFTQFLDDKNIAHDMVYTKQAKKALNYGEYLRETGEKGYWKGMEENIMYDMNQYSMADDQTALTMSAPKYIKSIDITREIMDRVKEMKFDITEESPYVQAIGSDGRPQFDANGNPVMIESKWIVTKKNGDLIEPYLQAMFLSEYANRGDVTDYYTQIAKNERIKWLNQNADNYASIDEANKAYADQIINSTYEKNKQTQRDLDDMVSNKKNQIASEQLKLEAAQSEGDDTSAQYYDNHIKEYIDELNAMNSSAEYMGQKNRQVESGNFNTKAIDSYVGNALLTTNIANSAHMASMYGYEKKYEVNPYKKMEMEQAFQWKMQERKFELQKDLEQYKKSLDKQEYANPLNLVTGLQFQGNSATLETDTNGQSVVDTYKKIFSEGAGTLPGEMTEILNNAVIELKSIAEDSNNPKAWEAKQLYSQLMIESMSQEEQLSLAKECGGDYGKWYDKLRDKSYNFVQSDSYAVASAYDKLNNNWRLANNTLTKYSEKVGRINGRMSALDEGWSGTKRDLSGAIEQLEDEDKALVKAYYGISKGQSVDSWDGRVANFDTYFHLGKQYGIPEYKLIDAWKDNSVKEKAGDALDKISSKTAYAIKRGALSGLDSDYTEGSAFTTTNDQYDTTREDIVSLLTLAAENSSAIVYKGDFSDKMQERDESLVNYLRSYATYLSNPQDSKSTNKYAYNIAVSPITCSNKDLFGLRIYDPNSKSDDNDGEGISIAIPKELLERKNIDIYESTKSLPYSNMLSWAKSPIPIIAADNTSLKWENKGKPITMFYDNDGNVVTYGKSWVINPETGSPELMDLNYNWGFVSADDIANSIVAMCSAWERYYQSKNR